MLAWIAIAAAAPSEAPALPVWMAGCWEMRTEQRWTEECWSKPRGKMMIGYSRSGTSDRVDEWESMQIIPRVEAGHAVVRLGFWAAPQGRSATLFAWSPSKDEGISFYNVANDYPQRIRYWRDGADLMAEISMADGSKKREWRYKRSSR